MTLNVTNTIMQEYEMSSLNKNRNGETGDDEYEEGEYDLSLDEFYDYVDSLNLDDQEVINVEDIEFHDLTIKNIRDYLEK